MSTDGLHQPRATTPLEQQLENFTPNSHHSSGWMRRIPAWQQYVCTVSAFQQQVSRSHFAPKNIWAGTRLLFSQQHWDCLMSICSLHIGAERNQCALDSPNAQLRSSTSKFRISQIFMLLKPAYRVKTLLNLLAATKKTLMKYLHSYELPNHSQPNAQFHSFPWILIQSSYTWMENIKLCSTKEPEMPRWKFQQQHRNQAKSWKYFSRKNNNSKYTHAKIRPDLKTGLEITNPAQVRQTYPWTKCPRASIDLFGFIRHKFKLPAAELITRKHTEALQEMTWKEAAFWLTLQTPQKVCTLIYTFSNMTVPKEAKGSPFPALGHAHIGMHSPCGTHCMATGGAPKHCGWWGCKPLAAGGNQGAIGAWSHLPTQPCHDTSGMLPSPSSPASLLHEQ